jgi:hypothetical protein
MEASSNSAPGSGLIRAGQFFFKYRDLLFPLVFLPVALGTRPAVLLGDPLADEGLEALGVLVVLAGQGLRALVIGLAYIRRGGKNRQIYAQDLVRPASSPTAATRSTSNPLIIAGLVLIRRSLMYGFVLPFFLFVCTAIVAAEGSTSAHFGPQYAGTAGGAALPAACAARPRRSAAWTSTGSASCARVSAFFRASTPCSCCSPEVRPRARIRCLARPSGRSDWCGSLSSWPT